MIEQCSQGNSFSGVLTNEGTRTWGSRRIAGSMAWDTNLLLTLIFIYSSLYFPPIRCLNFHAQATLLFLYNVFYFPCFHNRLISIISNLLGEVLRTSPYVSSNETS